MHLHFCTVIRVCDVVYMYVTSYACTMCMYTCTCTYVHVFCPSLISFPFTFPLFSLSSFLLPPSLPPSLFYQPRLQTCVCSIAEDYSVAILSTSERKCLLVAAVHSAPVCEVAWRLQEDFLLVSCTDGKLYVWQIETGEYLQVHIVYRVFLVRGRGRSSSP